MGKTTRIVVMSVRAHRRERIINNNNINNNNNKLQLDYHPVAVVILRVHKYEKKSN